MEVYMKKFFKWLFTNWYGDKSPWWANAVGAILIIILLYLVLR